MKRSVQSFLRNAAILFAGVIRLCLLLVLLGDFKKFAYLLMQIAMIAFQGQDVVSTLRNNRFRNIKLPYSLFLPAHLEKIIWDLAVLEGARFEKQ